MKISIIVACDKNRLIGVDGRLPWHLPDDLKRFKALTLGKPVIMGRGTFASLGYKPLPNRLNIVLGSYPRGVHLDDGYYTASSLPQALAYLKTLDTPEVFIIGGQRVYEEALALGLADTLYLTLVYLETVEDGANRRYFPKRPWGNWFEAIPKEIHPTHAFCVFTRIPR